MKRKRTSSAPRPIKRFKPIVKVGTPDDLNNLDVVTAPLVAAQVTASVSTCNLITPGTSPTTRIGRTVWMKSLEYRFVGALAPTTAGHSPIRLCIVYDRQTNGAIPATTDVFLVNTLDSCMNLANRKRFKVLVDEIIDQGLSTAGPGAFYRKGFRDFTGKGRKKGLLIDFKDTSAGTIADITNGAIFSYVWQGGGLITANPTSSLFTRIRFVP